MVLGIVFGSYGVAAAAYGGSGSGSTTTTPAPLGATAQNPWGMQRSDETLLTGDTAAKVQAAALAKVGGDATVIRVETDADGHAAHEVHLTKTDGTPATVYVDESYAVVSVETR